MTLHIGTAGGVQAVTGLYVGTASGVQTVTAGYIGTASGVQQFYTSGGGGGGGGGSSFTAAASPTSQSWTPWTIDAGDIYLATVNVTPSGGTGPYTYAWQIATGSAGIDDSTAQSTGLYDGTTETVTAYCVVTDSLGATATSNSVTVHA